MAQEARRVMVEHADPAKRDAVRPRMFGGIPEDRIAAASVPRIDPDILAKLRTLADLTCTIADALDQIGCGSVLPAPALVLPSVGQRACGPAITMRCAPYGGDPYANRNRGADQLYGDRD